MLTPDTYLGKNKMLWSRLLGRSPEGKACFTVKLTTKGQQMYE